MLGIGTGDSSVETLNKKPATLAQLEQSVSFMRALIASETVPHPESGAPVRITYATSGTRIPLLLAVSSPRIHRLAGRIGDGAIVLVGTDPDYLAQSRKELEAGAVEAGRDLRADGFRVVCWTPCSIQNDGKAARDAVKAHVARILKRRLPLELDPDTMEVARKIRATYEYYSHRVPGSAHSEIVPDDLVDEIAIIPHGQQPCDREHKIRLIGEAIGAA